MFWKLLSVSISFLINQLHIFHNKTAQVICKLKNRWVARKGAARQGRPGHSCYALACWRGGNSMLGAWAEQHMLCVGVLCVGVLAWEWACGYFLAGRRPARATRATLWHARAWAEPPMLCVGLLGRGGNRMLGACGYFLAGRRPARATRCRY